MDPNGWLKVLLDGISTQITDLDRKFDTFSADTCPLRHKETADRVLVLEQDSSNRKYLNRWIMGAVAFISGLVGAFGDKLWRLIANQ